LATKSHKASKLCVWNKNKTQSLKANQLTCQNMQQQQHSHSPMASGEQQKAALAALSKDCQMLWEENKDMQGRFVNDISELQRFQLAIQQLEHEQRHEQLGAARQSMWVKRGLINFYYNWEIIAIPFWVF